MYIDLTIEEAKELIDLIRGGNRQQEEPKKRRKEGNEEETAGFGKGKGIT